MSRPSSTATAATAALLLSALALPTGAAAAKEVVSRVALTDPTGDVWVIAEGEAEEWASAGDEPTLDVERAVVRHRRHTIIVAMTFTDLRRVEPQSYSATLITPEHYGAVFVSAEPGHWRGRHQLVDEEFGTVKCRGLEHSIDYATERVVITVPRSCVGKPPWVKAGMANYAFRGATEDDFQELTDNPHSTGPAEDRLTRRVYRQVLSNEMLSVDKSGDVTKDDFVGDDRVVTVQPRWHNGDITRLTARHRHHRVTARMKFVDLKAGSRQPWMYHHFLFLTNGGGGFDLTGNVGVDGGGGQGEWRLSNGRRVTCRGLRHTIDYRSHTVRVSVPRSCLGRPTWVRVGGSTDSWSEAHETYRSDDGLSTGKNATIDAGAPPAPEPPPVGRRLPRG